MHIQSQPTTGGFEYVFVYQRTCIKCVRRHTCEYMRENVIIREYILPNIVGGELIHCSDQYCRLEHNIVANVCHANVQSAE